MGYGHASKVADFIKTDNDALIGQLVNGVASTGISTHTTTQIVAWRQEISLLQEQLSNPRVRDWFVILEYEIPRRSRRPDVILLSPTTIFVIEFKVGGQHYDSTSQWQVNSYARDLRDFHSESYQRRIVPILCATSSESGDFRKSFGTGDTTDLVTSIVMTNGSNLAPLLVGLEEKLTDSSSSPICPEQWLISSYRPTPTIVEAATALYEGHVSAKFPTITPIISIEPPTCYRKRDLPSNPYLADPPPVH